MTTQTNPLIPRGLWPPADWVFLSNHASETLSERYECAAYWHKVLCEHTDLTPASDVLEVGFGAGRSSRVLWEYLSSEGSYCGLDVVADMVEWHESNITPLRPNVKFFHANVANPHYDDKHVPAPERMSAADYVFPFPDESFDVVFLASVFTHMFQDQVGNYLRQIRRVLRPGGCVLSSCFLVDQDLSARIEEGDTELGPGSGEASISLPDIKLFTFDENTWVQRPEQPEVFVAHSADNYRKLHEDAGLDLSQFWVRGHWSGVSNGVGQAGQDVVVARRPQVFLKDKRHAYQQG